MAPFRKGANISRGIVRDQLRSRFTLRRPLLVFTFDHHHCSDEKDKDSTEKEDINTLKDLGNVFFYDFFLGGVGVGREKKIKEKKRKGKEREEKTRDESARVRVVPCALTRTTILP